MKTHLAVLVAIAAIGCAHSSESHTASHMDAATTVSGTTAAAEQTTIAGTTNTTVERGPVTITTIVEDAIPATPKRPAHVRKFTRVEEHGPVQIEQEQATTAEAARRTETTIQATQQVAATATTQTASSTRVGPGLMGWIGIVAGVLVVIGLGWRFRKLLGIGI